jgi:hypothetical protein
VTKKDQFIKAYHNFRDSVDFSKRGFMPEIEDIACYLLLGVPPVPADDDSCEEAPIIAVDQRVAILKAVFVELNRDQAKTFLDEGMMRYDKAGKRAKKMIRESVSFGDLERGSL